MKVLHVVHGYFPEGSGGIQVYVRDLTQEQRRAGLDVRLLTGSQDPRDRCGTETVQVDGSPVLRLHRDDIFFDHYAKAYHPAVATLMREILERERPDVLHLHQWLRLTCNLVEIADRLGIPSVLTLHDVYTSCPRCYRVRADGEACFEPLSVESCFSCVPRFGHETDAEIREGIQLFKQQYLNEVRRARAVLVANDATAELLSDMTGTPRDRYEVMPLAHARRFPDGAVSPAPPPGAGQALRFGYWGTITARKGLAVLLQGLRIVKDRDPSAEVELHLFGRIDTDELEQELHALAEGLPVVFHSGFEYEDLRRTRLHMGVFPSLCFETHGLVLDECFELGLPCIVTDIGALPRRAGAAGLVVPPGDANAMASAIQEILARPSLRDELRTRLPALPPTPREHQEALAGVYARARSASPHGVPDISPEHWATFMLRQRESAQARLCPEGGPR